MVISILYWLEKNGVVVSSMVNTIWERSEVYYLENSGILTILLE